MHILVVEDEPRMAELLRRGLLRHGHVVDVAASGEDALALAATGTHAAVVLDLRLPGIDGVETCRQLRERGATTPVLMLTARDGIADRVAGLDAGADDYLVKPFAFAELAARVRAHTRRPSDQRRGAASIEVGPLSLDLLAREAEVNGIRIALSAREFALLAYLMRHPGQVLSRQQILDGVWGYSFDPRSNLVDVYIGYLRRKLATDGLSPIQTVRGMGYRLVRERAA